MNTLNLVLNRILIVPSMGHPQYLAATPEISWFWDPRERRGLVARLATIEQLSYLCYRNHDQWYFV